MTVEKRHRLTPRQRQMIEILARGSNYEVAAREVGVSPRTLFEWRRKPQFETALRDAQNELLTSARDNLRATMLDAVATLRSIMNDVAAPAAARVRAASVILDHVQGTLEIQELEQRLGRLEVLAHHGEAPQ